MRRAAAYLVSGIRRILIKAPGHSHGEPWTAAEIRDELADLLEEVGANKPAPAPVDVAERSDGVCLVLEGGPDPCFSARFPNSSRRYPVVRADLAVGTAQGVVDLLWPSTGRGPWRELEGLARVPTYRDQVAELDQAAELEADQVAEPDKSKE